METIRSKVVREGPFPGSHIPLKLREIFSRAGIQETVGGRIPWDRVPYHLYDKGLYIVGLPTNVFFANDKPSPQEINQRLEEVLKWPPSGSENPLKILEKACAIEDRVGLLPRPPNRNVVFELVSEDGTKYDLPQWKAPPPAAVPARRPTLDTLPSPVNTLPRPSSSAQPTDTVMSSVKPSVQPKETIASSKKPEGVISASSKVPPKALTTTEPYPKSTTIPLKFREMLHHLGLPESKQHPGSVGWVFLPNVLWKKGYYISGIPSTFILDSKNPTTDAIERKMRAKFSPNVARAGGLPALEDAIKKNQVKIEKRPPGRDVVFEVITGSGPYDIGKWKDKDPPQPLEKLAKVPAPSSKPAAATASSSSKTTVRAPLAPKPTIQPAQAQTTRAAKTTGVIKPVRRQSRIIASSDEEETPSASQPSTSIPFLDPVSSPFPGSINVPINLRRLLDVAGVKEHQDKEVVPWADVPYVLWREGYYISGLPREFVLGKNTPEEVITKLWQPQELFRTNPTTTQSIADNLNNGKIRLLRREEARNVVFEIEDAQGRKIDIGRWTAAEPIYADSDVEMDDDDEEEEEATNVHPRQKWIDDVNEVMDQLAEMFVDAGANLPPHPQRENKYKIPWSDLPALLHEAGVTLGGFPLILLPYWRAQSRLNGRWSLKWTRESLDKVADLLDCDALAVEKWGKNSKVIVTAFDANHDHYDFTYDDFVNAAFDDPEHQALDGVLTRVVLPGRRKRKASTDSGSERAAKRHKPRHSSASTVDVISLLEDADSDDMETENDNPPPESPAKSDSESIIIQRRTLMGDVPLDPVVYWQPPQDPNLTIAELNEKAQRNKAILKELIAILIYNDIPCIAPTEERLAYFVPWSNLPRHLAARSACLSGLPDVCAPVVVDDAVVAESGPACWSDSQWEALEEALLKGAVYVQKTTRKILFELVSSDGKKTASAVKFSKTWLNCNLGIEAGQSISVMADEVAPMDPILVETEDECSDSDTSMDE